MPMSKNPGASARAELGWMHAYKWLLLRRLSQIGILTLFLLGPWLGIWIVKGNLASSLTLEVLPLTDPLLLLQTLVAGHPAETAAITGALIVAVFYFLVGGRGFCSWVCPVNLVTDAAAWLRLRLGLRNMVRFSRSTRYWILGLTLVLSLATGTLVWELLNPVSLMHRGIIFGVGLAWTVILGIFLFDLFISDRGWCGHLCPMGAFYSLLAWKSPVRVSAKERDKCDDCMDCFAVCPEPQVIKPALKGAGKRGPVILSPNCTNCGRCIDVCAKQVFRFDLRTRNLVDIS